MPLPIEKPGHKAKDLIARFQSSINSGAEAPLKPRHSFGSNEVFDKQQHGEQPRRDSLDVGPGLATSSRRLSFQSGSTTPEERFRSPSPAVVPPQVSSDASSSSVPVSGTAIPAVEAAELSQDSKGQEGSISTLTAADASTTKDKEQIADPDIPNSSSQVASTEPAVPFSGTVNPHAHSGNPTEASTSSIAPSTPAKISTISKPKDIKVASSSNLSATKGPPSPYKREPASPAAVATPSTSSTPARAARNTTPSSASTAQSLRKSVSSRAMTPTAASLAKARASVTSPPPLSNGNGASTSSPSPSTSRLMKPTASSATKARTPAQNASEAGISPSTSRTSISSNNRPSSAMSSHTPPTRGPRVARPSTSLGDSSPSGTPSSGSRIKVLSPAALARMEAAAQTGTGVMSSSSSPLSRPTRKMSTASPSSVAHTGRGSPSLAMASRSTPVKRPKTPEGGVKTASPGVVKQGIIKTPAKTTAKAATTATPARKTPTTASTPSAPTSASTSRLTRPTASSAAHTRSPIHTSSSHTDTPSKSASSPVSKPGTIGARVPAGRVPPKDAGNETGPKVKIGVVSDGVRGGTSEQAKLPVDKQANGSKAIPKEAEQPGDVSTVVTDSDNRQLGEETILALQDKAAKLEISTGAQDGIRSPLEPEQQPDTPQLEGAEVLPTAPVVEVVPPTAPSRDEQFINEVDNLLATAKDDKKEGLPIEAKDSELPPDSEAPPLAGACEPESKDDLKLESSDTAEKEKAEGDSGSQSGEKVFKGFGPDRPLGKISAPVSSLSPSSSSSPLPSATSAPLTSPSHSSACVSSSIAAPVEDYASKWGSRDGASSMRDLPSPGLAPSAGSNRSGATSPANGAGAGTGTGETKKVPIWMRKGGQ